MKNGDNVETWLKIAFAIVLIIAYLFVFYNIYEAQNELESMETTTQKEETNNFKEDIENKLTIDENELFAEIDFTEFNTNNNTELETISETAVNTDYEEQKSIHTSLVEFELTDYERWIVECIVMGESGGEPYEGQMLVAQCILNACLKDDITPSEVREKYKYSGWNENPTDSVKRAVNSVFDLGEKVTNEPILYFYAPSLIQSKWHETQTFVIECGGHRFFKEK